MAIDAGERSYPLLEAFGREQGAGLLTLVFTDIVGSTALKRQCGEHRAVALIQRHHASLRAILGRFPDAQEIETAGDSFLLVFGRPSEAVKFSLQLQARLGLLAQEAGQPVLDRIGIHVGEVFIQGQAGSAMLFGSQVDLCARVMELAEANQVLMTRFAFDNARRMVRAEELAGIGPLSWLNHGLYRFEGVEEVVEVCEVRAGTEGPATPPTSSERAHRLTGEGELVLGWRPAVGQAVPSTNWMLEEKLGEGGFGEVWKAQHEKLREHRVFKFCFQADRVRSLKREVTLFRLLKERIGENPNLVKLHDINFDEPPFYLEEEYVAGRDLRTWSEDQRGVASVPLETRLEIVAQAAEGLQAAHDAGVIHRDIKPGNILIADWRLAIGDSGNPAEPEAPHLSARVLPPAVVTKPASPSQIANQKSQILVKLSDFGIGQVVSKESLAGMTRAGFTQTMMSSGSSFQTGTHLYMAPELLAGKAASTRSDIYSLGVVLYQLLLGDFARPVTTDWAHQISDPLLQDDLRLCFAGNPQERFGGAAQLAVNLRSLEERRRALRAQEQALVARERAAYRRGMMRTAAAAATVITLLAIFASVAWVQRRAALRAQGESALEQASTLNQSSFLSGRRVRGSALLEIAAGTVTNHVGLRTAAASVLGMADLVRIPTLQAVRPPILAPRVPVATNETCRTISGDGSLVAIARDLDGLNGAVDLFETATGHLRLTIVRKDFPWLPVAEPGMLRFSPDDKIIAMGGAHTSRHLLLFGVADGALRSYLFHGSDPLSCAWHPGGRVLAVGCADGRIRIWDTAAAVSPSEMARSTNEFDLPPSLTVPARDIPIQILRGHRGPVRHLAFATNGQWLASLDQEGYLRVYTGFSREGLPQLPPATHAGEARPGLAVEVRVDKAEGVSSLATEEDRVVIRRSNAPGVAYRILPRELPAELYIAPGLTDLAWNATGTELCATTFSDVYWLRANPLEVFTNAVERNPTGVSWQESSAFWALPVGKKFAESRLVAKGGAWAVENGSSFDLQPAEQGQGVLTAMAAAGDGRIAMYHGRRIQFFRNHQAAPQEFSIKTEAGGDRFESLFWDYPGRLLGAAYALPNGNIRLQTWETTSDFPPKTSALPQAELECQIVVPANDGRRCIARGGRSGIFRLEPATGIKNGLDASDSARQKAPLAATPDGRFLATVVDRNQVHLSDLPAGLHFADLHNPREDSLTCLAWDGSGRHLAAITESGYVEVWDLLGWKDWITRHRLQK